MREPVRDILVACLAVLALAACQQAPASNAEVPSGAEWLLQGSQDERMIKVASHLRGFDMAMVETGHRYMELYWAGQDRNWGYAAYQLEKMETAVNNGLERRPARAASARMLDGSILSVREAIEAEDGDAMDTAFAQLTATCNACHNAEEVPFMHVAPPEVRVSPIRAEARTEVEAAPE